MTSARLMYLLILFSISKEKNIKILRKKFKKKIKLKKN